MYELMVIVNSIWRLFLQIAPYWGLGLLAGSLVSVYFSGRIADAVVGLAAGRFRLVSVLAGAVLGVVSPLCMFGTVPVIAAFSKKKVPEYLLAAFMVSSVLLNPNIFLLTFVLGTDIALMRLGLSVLGGVFAGCLVLLFFEGKGRALFDFRRFGDGAEKKKKTLLRDLLKAFRITAPYLLLGITLSALFSRYVPPEWVAGIFGGGARRGFGVLLATSLSVPLYACGGGIIPLVRAWMFAGMGAGDAMAFMIAGPATKITNISAVKMILGARNFTMYLLYCFAFAVLAGLVTAVLL